MTTHQGFIGSYTKKEGQGIYQFELNNNQITVNVAYKVPASTYVIQYNDYLYGLKTETKSGVQAYKIDDELEVINDCLVDDGNGCHLSITEDGKYLFEALYGAGQVRVYRLKDDGSIDAHIDTLQQEGNGPHERQDAAHTHYVSPTYDGYVVAVDLGTDEVITFKFENEKLKKYKVFKAPPGSGPRHLVFSKNKKYSYIMTELSNEVFVTEYNDGEFTLLERYSTLPETFEGHSQGAAIRLSNDGKHLYVSNRGHNSIVVFEVLEEDKGLKKLQTVSTEGDWPRDFNISNDDQYLICAHERSGNVTLFERDKTTGQLTYINNTAQAEEGVCVQFLK